MNREQIRTRALNALNDSETEPTFWELEEMNQLLQEGQEVLCEEVEALTRTVYIPERPGTMFYHLNGLGLDIMAPWRIWTRNRQHRLWPLSMTELDSHYERWLTVTGSPEWWFLVSWDCIGVWPASTAGGGLFEVDCYVWPEPLQADSEEPAFHDPDHDFLVRFMEMEGQLKQWDTARALEIGIELFSRAKDSKARSNLRAMQQRFFGREGYGYDNRA